MGDRWSVKGAWNAEDMGWLEYEEVAGEVGRDGRRAGVCQADIRAVGTSVHAVRPTGTRSCLKGCRSIRTCRPRSLPTLGRGARASPGAARSRRPQNWMSPHTSALRSAFALCRGGVVGFEVACVGRAELCPDRGIEGNRFCEAGWP
jgi:hypothetical protein